MKGNHVKQRWKLLTPYLVWLLSIMWLSFLCWLAFLWHLGDTGLVDETEPLFAEAARQMTVTGNWITPYFNGVTRFDKPPLVYWLMALGYQTIGVNEWAVRLPSAISAIALTIFCFLTLRFFGFTNINKTNISPRQLWLAAWLGAAFISLNIQTIIWARTGVSDMLLSGCMGGALLCFFWGYATRSKREEGKGKNQEEINKQDFPDKWYLAFYILSALAVLTKGPVGIVLPGIVIVSFLLYMGKLREVLQEMQIVKGGLIFSIITLPWYFLVTLKNGAAFTDSFFGYHNLERFTGVVNGHTAPWYFYFLVILVGFIPWSIYLPLAINRLQWWRISFWRHQPREAQLGIFAFFWLIGIFVFFTVAVTKLPSYVLPLLSAAAILVAIFWSEIATATDQKLATNQFGLLISGIINSLLLIILAILFVYSPNLIGSDKAAPNLERLFAQSGLPWLGGIIWLTAALIIALLLTAPKYRRYLWGVNLGAFIAFIIFVLTPTSFLVDHARQLPLRNLSAEISQVKQPGEEVMMIGFNKPSLVFYTQNPVRFFNNTSGAQQYIKDNHTAVESPSSFLLLVRPRYIKKLKLKPDEYQLISQQGPYTLIRFRRQALMNK